MGTVTIGLVTGTLPAVPRKKKAGDVPDRAAFLKALRDELVGVADRLEEARKALGRSGRASGALLLHQTQYTGTVGRLRKGTIPSYEILRAVTDVFVADGYRLPWLLLGMPPARSDAGEVPDLRVLRERFEPRVHERYREHAAAAVDTLARRGWHPAAAWDAVRRVAMKELAGDFVGPMDLVEGAEIVLHGQKEAPAERIWGPGDDEQRPTN